MACACELCGTCEGELHVSTSWTGEFHAACLHAACEACLRTYLVAELPRCPSTGVLRVPCYAAGCTRVLPQRLVWHLAGSEARAAQHELEQREARVKASRLEIQWFHSACVGCRRVRGAQVVACPAGHAACEDCWRDKLSSDLDLDACDTQLQMGCVDPCCKEVMGGESPGVRWASTLPSMLPRTLKYHIARRAAGVSPEVGEAVRLLQDDRLLVHWQLQTCGVCQEPRTICFGDKGCQHAMCMSCWGKWADVQMPRCHDEKRLHLRCFAEKCQSAFLDDHPIARCLALPAVAEAFTPTSTAILRGLGRRRRLQQNDFYTADMQVDCPLPGCLGLGYLGQDTVMCFVCEHLWVPTAFMPDPTDGTGDAGVPTGEVKNCPKCEVPIMKDGGCDHMTCRCKYEFWWTTLAAYRTA